MTASVAEATRADRKINNGLLAGLGEVGLRRVGVFCSVKPTAERYVEPVTRFAQLLGQRGYSLTWGGSKKGLMGDVASAAQEAGAKLFGISVIGREDGALKTADKLSFAASHREQKVLIIKNSDVLVMMPGGVGTLNEAMEAIESKRQGDHNKPLVILNIDGFYDGLHQQLQRMEEDGFLVGSLDKYAYFAQTPEQAMEYIDALPPPAGRPS